jgi:hypothetical protein
MTSEYLLLYHGTSLSKLESILKDGIMPRRLSGKSNWDNESHHNMVYLTNSYAPHYSLCSMDVEEDKPVVLEIKFDEESMMNLFPDEDALEQANNSKYAKSCELDNLSLAERFDVPIGFSEMTIEDRTLWFKDNLYHFHMDSSNRMFYEKSLALLGTCCHEGMISADKIVRYTLLKPEKILSYSDPVICIPNQMILGGHYQNVCSNIIWDKEYSEKVVVL